MNELEKVLAEYHKYLTCRKLANEARAPYLVRWVREFLRFAKGKRRHLRTLRPRPWPCVRVELSEPATCRANSAWLVRFVPYDGRDRFFGKS